MHDSRIELLLESLQEFQHGFLDEDISWRHIPAGMFNGNPRAIPEQISGGLLEKIEFLENLQMKQLKEFMTNIFQRFSVDNSKEIPGSFSERIPKVMEGFSMVCG